MLKDLEKNLTDNCLERFSEIFPYPRKKTPFVYNLMYKFFFILNQLFILI